MQLVKSIIFVLLISCFFFFLIRSNDSRTDLKPCPHCNEKFIEKNRILSDKYFCKKFPLMEKLVGFVQMKCRECKQILPLRECASHFYLDCILTCPWNCGDVMSRSLLVSHSTICQEFIVDCRGEKLGCSFRMKRELVNDHQKDCPMSKMEPYFMSQQKRIQQLESTVRQLYSEINTIKNSS